MYVMSMKSLFKINNRRVYRIKNLNFQSFLISVKVFSKYITKAADTHNSRLSPHFLPADQFHQDFEHVVEFAVVWCFRNIFLKSLYKMAENSFNVHVNNLKNPLSNYSIISLLFQFLSFFFPEDTD